MVVGNPRVAWSCGMCPPKLVVLMLVLRPWWAFGELWRSLGVVLASVCMMAWMHWLENWNFEINVPITLCMLRPWVLRVSVNFAILQSVLRLCTPQNTRASINTMSMKSRKAKDQKET